jgi:hypothetical protein
MSFPIGPGIRHEIRGDCALLALEGLENGRLYDFVGLVKPSLAVSGSGYRENDVCRATKQLMSCTCKQRLNLFG